MITEHLSDLYPTNFTVDLCHQYFTLDHRFVTISWLHSWVLSILTDFVSQFFKDLISVLSLILYVPDFL